ncbi:MAG: VOC family protein [Candidatus Eremiobacteraeota bacterium]|nr:VOC family protein [Candidatus Eremiobacteraeota bacterium]MBV9055360.1 VOC family protein [Candidatus Eremiobacteraeota bacterium]MBV9700651.1 VOC family protein [Candidatus Eremiobacteraeota bacterium]
MDFEPYLLFDGKCEEALNFYKGIFGGNIELMRWSDAPKDAGGPPVTEETKNRVMHGRFKADGIAFMAGDATPGKTYGEGPISLSVGLTDVAAADRIFNALGAGGNVEMPMQEMFWGAKFGMLTDKYGIDWMVNCELKK